MENKRNDIKQMSNLTQCEAFQGKVCLSKSLQSSMVTRAVAVVIFVPPEAPTTIFTLLCLSKMIVGHIEDRGLLPGSNTKRELRYLA